MHDIAFSINSSFLSIVRLSMALTKVSINYINFFYSIIKNLCAWVSSVERFAISLTTLVMASSKFPALNYSYFFIFNFGVSDSATGPVRSLSR